RVRPADPPRAQARRPPSAHAAGSENAASGMMGPMRLHAMRGATTVDRNDPDAILGATEWLLREIMKRNDLIPEDVVSCIFTLTEDLDAQFPAVAARNLGFDHVPLLCAREIPVPESLPRVIRV